MLMVEYLWTRWIETGKSSRLSNARTMCLRSENPVRLTANGVNTVRESFRLQDWTNFRPHSAKRRVTLKVGRTVISSDQPLSFDANATVSTEFGGSKMEIVPSVVRRKPWGEIAGVYKKGPVIGAELMLLGLGRTDPEGSKVVIVRLRLVQTRDTRSVLSRYQPVITRLHDTHWIGIARSWRVERWCTLGWLQSVLRTAETRSRSGKVPIWHPTLIVSRQRLVFACYPQNSEPA